MLITADRSTLLVIDVQANLLPAVADGPGVVRGASVLMTAAARLGIPIVVSEQYPRGLGPTVPELAALAPEGAVMEKLHFSCAADTAILARLSGLGRDQVVIVGMEAHVCVLQSALGLKQAGLHPWVVGDAVSSRTPANHQAAISRLAASGVGIATVEMVLFEWLHRAGTPEFKDLSKLIK